MPFFSKGPTGQQTSSPISSGTAPASWMRSGPGIFGVVGNAGVASFGAGQGPTPSTGQLSDNPFQNTFNFQIPSTPALGAPSDNSSQTSTGNGGVSGYVPIIVVGVIIAGLGYYLFQRKK